MSKIYSSFCNIKFWIVFAFVFWLLRYDDTALFFGVLLGVSISQLLDCIEIQEVDDADVL